MKPCIALHCNGTATKDSDYCLTCAIEAHGAFAIIAALKGDLMPDMYYPVTPPARVWDGIVERIKQGEGQS